MLVRGHVWVGGEVQGVLFRAYTRDEAQRLGLTGWVRNLPDGRVEAVFEGSQPQVKQAVEWCRRGPPAAHVTGVEVSWEPYRGEFAGFRVAR